MSPLLKDMMANMTPSQRQALNKLMTQHAKQKGMNIGNLNTPGPDLFVWERDHLARFVGQLSLENLLQRKRSPLIGSYRSRIIWKGRYDKRMVEEIKKIKPAARSWHPEYRAWSFKDDQLIISNLEGLSLRHFGGYYVHPGGDVVLKKGNITYHNETGGLFKRLEEAMPDDAEGIQEDAPPPGTLYAVLNVPQAALQKRIKKAYRKQVMKHHPDKPNGSREKFDQVKEAYDTLSDVQERKKYDAALSLMNFESEDDELPF